MFCSKENYELYKNYLDSFYNKNENIRSCLIYKEKQNDEIKIKLIEKKYIYTIELHKDKQIIDLYNSPFQ